MPRGSSFSTSSHLPFSVPLPTMLLAHLMDNGHFLVLDDNHPNGCEGDLHRLDTFLTSKFDNLVQAHATCFLPQIWNQLLAWGVLVSSMGKWFSRPRSMPWNLEKLIAPGLVIASRTFQWTEVRNFYLHEIILTLWLQNHTWRVFPSSFLSYTYPFFPPC